MQRLTFDAAYEEINSHQSFQN